MLLLTLFAAGFSTQTFSFSLNFKNQISLCKILELRKKDFKDLLKMMLRVFSRQTACRQGVP